MDAERFDTIVRSFGGRLSRRSALRGGGVGVAALLGAIGLGRARGAPGLQPTPPRYVVVRRYRPNVAIDQLRQTLGEGYVPLLAQQPGFVEYSVLVSGTDLTSITTFETQALEEAASQALAGWVQQNLASLLPAPTDVTGGGLIVYGANPDAYCPIGSSTPTPAATTPSPAPTALPICTDPAEPGRGCPCITGTRNPCGVATLLCCPNRANQPPGGSGTCVPDRIGCSPLGRPTSTPSPAPTTLPVCTDPARPGVGCACTTGTRNPCGDTTLVCCKNDPAGPPGSAGTCTPTSVGCAPTGPTPTPQPTSTPAPSPTATPARCAGLGCRCNGGVEDECETGLICCPDNRDRPGGPGFCDRERVCYPSR